MYSPTRARTSFGHWLLIAVLIGVLVFAPSVVARSVTAADEPVDFLRQPWSGWAFAGIVLRESLRAETASPGEALSEAQRRWDGASGRAQATRVELLYLPHSVSWQAPGMESRAPRPSNDLAWQVFGVHDRAEAERVVGMIDFTTGEYLWDIDRENSRGGNTPMATGKDAA